MKLKNLFSLLLGGLHLAGFLAFAKAVENNPDSQAGMDWMIWMVIDLPVSLLVPLITRITPDLEFNQIMYLGHGLLGTLWWMLLPWLGAAIWKLHKQAAPTNRLSILMAFSLAVIAGFGWILLPALPGSTDIAWVDLLHPDNWHFPATALGLLASGLLLGILRADKAFGLGLLASLPALLIILKEEAMTAPAATWPFSFTPWLLLAMASIAGTLAGKALRLHMRST